MTYLNKLCFRFSPYNPSQKFSQKLAGIQNLYFYDIATFIIIYYYWVLLHSMVNLFILHQNIKSIPLAIVFHPHLYLLLSPGYIVITKIPSSVSSYTTLSTNSFVSRPCAIFSP
jgi:hypothetical protein